MIRVVLADDHELVRSGIRALLETTSDIEVVGEASDGRQALDRVSALGPDVLVLDVTMPELNGLDVARRVKRSSPNTGVLLLSMHSGDSTIRKALDAGADGYLLKDAGPLELSVAVRAIARGDGYLSPPIAKRIMEGRLPGGEDELLTERQREVLQLVAEGHSTKAVARRLGLSPKTVENHRAHVMERLGVRGVPGLVRYAIAQGLIPSGVTSTSQ